MAVPIDLLNNSEPSSDDDFSDSEISDSWEDESMEDEPSESEITMERGNIYHSLLLPEIFAFYFSYHQSREIVTKSSETETNRGEEEEFWVKYPYLKNFVSTVAAQGLIPEYYAYERAKLIGDEKAKELNEKGKALFLKELEVCKETCELIVYAIIAIKSVL